MTFVAGGRLAAGGQEAGGARHPIQVDSGGRLIPGEDITEVSGTQDLSTGPLSDAIPPIGDFGINYIWFVADQAITETVSIKIEAAAGANYDVYVQQWTWQNRRYQFWAPSQPLALLTGNIIVVECTDNNSVGNIYYVVGYVTR